MSLQNSTAQHVVVWDKIATQLKQQEWVHPALYVVATPIGNLADLSLRAWHVLSRCDVIAAEDTRDSQTLLKQWGITASVVAVHRHNEAEGAAQLIGFLAANQSVALISDAGSPAISDPGARVVAAVAQAGYRVVPIPGPSAVTTALMASGATSDAHPEFLFAGFVPSKSGQRRKWLSQWKQAPHTVVMFETPHRIVATVQAFRDIFGAQQQVTLAKELTKRFETIVTLPCAELIAWLEGDKHHQRGEFVLILHPSPVQDVAPVASMQAIALVDALLEVMSVKDVATVLNKAQIMRRQEAYKLALSRASST